MLGCHRASLLLVKKKQEASPTENSFCFKLGGRPQLYYFFLKKKQKIYPCNSALTLQVSTDVSGGRRGEGRRPAPPAGEGALVAPLPSWWGVRGEAFEASP